jgi:hypothetical protein
MDASGTGPDPLLAARVRVPEHVVYRDFGGETVILNLDSGVYHGLNPTAAAMLKTAGESDSVGAAADMLAGEFGQPRDVIEPDLLELCHALEERGLIERDGGDGG